RSEASRRVKGTLLIEEIAKKEKIEATTADVEAELAGLAAQYQQPRERILEVLRPNIATLIQGIVRTKTVDYLIEHATEKQAS
nr:trigger factor [Candidatus Eremiobacteraeota bacterium]